MSLSEKTVSVLSRPLPKEKIKERPGKRGLTFSYIPPDLVIDLLNEAFDYNWSTRILDKKREEDVVIVELELSVPNGDGGFITKAHFGSCEITRGLGVGEAFKGAASDAMKKCATLLGLGLELYRDEDAPSAPAFTPPPRVPPRPPTTTPSAPRAPVGVVPPRPPTAPQASVQKESTPFALPPKNVVRPPSAPAVQAPKPPSPPKAMAANPFQNKNAIQTNGGPSPAQLTSLTNMASRKGLSQAELISLAGVVDDHGTPVEVFESLTYSQAIQVIQAAQH